VERQHTSVTRFFREQRALLASLLLFGLFLVELASLHRFTLYDLMVYDWCRNIALALSIASQRDWMTSGNNRLTVNLASGKTDSVLFTALAVYARQTNRNRE